MTMYVLKMCTVLSDEKQQVVEATPPKPKKRKVYKTDIQLLGI